MTSSTPVHSLLGPWPFVCALKRLAGLCLLLLLLVILPCTQCGLTNVVSTSGSGSGTVRDVNNMLRDNSDAALSDGVTETDADVDLDNFNAMSSGRAVGAIVGAKKLAGLSSAAMLRNSVARTYGNRGANADNSVDEESSVELLRFVNEDDVHSITSTTTTEQPTADSAVAHAGYAVSAEEDISAAPTADDNESEPDLDNLEDARTLRRQVHLLSKQLNALLTRRREDYEMLEHNLRKSLRITTNAATVDLDIRDELEQLRHEVKALRHGHLGVGGGNKERLTIEWLQQSVSELRKQLAELQQMASNAVKDISRRTQSYEDLATVRSDYQQLKLELVALKERQQQSENYVRELREEMLQQEEDYKRLLHNKYVAAEPVGQDSSESSEPQQKQVDSGMESADSDAGNRKLSTEMLADHKRRHCRFQRQQIRELQIAQHGLKRQLNELKYHRIGERVRNIEIEQHRIADANFNLSRQIASLDKLHSSMLELLEDVEDLQNKMDKSVPELRHEISKLEFSTAQLTSEQSLVREEGTNVARSVQAMAVSVSTLQDERDSFKQTQGAVTQLQTNVDRMQSMLQDVERALRHRHKGADGRSPVLHHHSHQPAHAHNISADTVEALMTLRAESLVAKLENVEEQYEDIINKLPADCAEVSNNNNNNNKDGLYLIAPTGQNRPLMAHCSSDGWTTVQRRFEGSVDFNRSWEDYANGFGTPSGEYWIGNEQLHRLTINNCTSLRVLMQDIYDSVWVAEYGYFYISSRADGYRLHVGAYRGNASDALDYQQGMQFSAIDVDRDISQTHCAANYEGGWWFSHCQHANLNGRYNLGLTWFDAARNEWIAVKSSQMLIKRQSVATCQYAAAAATADYSDAFATGAGVAPTTPTTISSSKLTRAAEATTATPLPAVTPV